MTTMRRRNMEQQWQIQSDRHHRRLSSLVCAVDYSPRMLISISIMVSLLLLIPHHVDAFPSSSFSKNAPSSFISSSHLLPNNKQLQPYHHYLSVDSQRSSRQQRQSRSMIVSAAASKGGGDTVIYAANNNNDNDNMSMMMNVDDAITNRYACTRFQPSSKLKPKTIKSVINKAYKALDMARRAPSGFNVQPYKLLIVSDQKQKDDMSKYCCGHNAHRVRESVCTVLFLADRQCIRNWNNYKQLSSSTKKSSTSSTKKKKKSSNLKTLCLISLFSSGFPYVPQFFSGPISFLMGLGMRIVSWITRSRLPVPTLTSSLTWSTKNTMLVAMSYMLSATSQGLATCPMEGYTTWGIRRMLKIPRRYSIPLIVATGLPFERNNELGKDDVGTSHGPPGTGSSTPRFDVDDTIYGNLFGSSCAASAASSDDDSLLISDSSNNNNSTSN